MEKTHIISALVSNESGVLTRISGMFARRCFNIDSLAVCATADEKMSRMTIAVRGDESVLKQLILQLDKLPDCYISIELPREEAVLSELLLIKLAASGENVTNTCASFGAKIKKQTASETIAEFSGEPDEVDAFIKKVTPFGIAELSRTGLTALSACHILNAELDG